VTSEAERVDQVRALAELHAVDLPQERATALAARYPEYQAALDLLRAEGLDQSEPALEFDPLGGTASRSS